MTHYREERVLTERGDDGNTYCRLIPLTKCGMFSSVSMVTDLKLWFREPAGLPPGVTTAYVGYYDAPQDRKRTTPRDCVFLDLKDPTAIVPEPLREYLKPCVYYRPELGDSAPLRFEFGGLELVASTHRWDFPVLGLVVPDSQVVVECAFGLEYTVESFVPSIASGHVRVRMNPPVICGARYMFRPPPEDMDVSAWIVELRGRPERFDSSSARTAIDMKDYLRELSGTCNGSRFRIPFLCWDLVVDGDGDGDGAWATFRVPVPNGTPIKHDFVKSDMTVYVATTRDLVSQGLFFWIRVWCEGVVKPPTPEHVALGPTFGVSF